jgi:hypothetical protein
LKAAPDAPGAGPAVVGGGRKARALPERVNQPDQTSRSGSKRNGFFCLILEKGSKRTCFYTYERFQFTTIFVKIQ